MNYFMSDIHGASSAYFELKDRIGFRNNDDLFILGDIFDGNNENPGECLTILNDIITSDNIHFVLGDHEYAHIMRYASKENDDNTKEWDYYLTNSSFGGEPLLNYFYNSLTEKERERYIGFLVNCEMTALVKIGQRYFYLTHGSPVACKNDDIFGWQKDVVTTPLSLKYNYSLAIANDPDMQMPKDMIKDNTYILAGHIPTRCYFESHNDIFQRTYHDFDLPTETNPQKQQIILSNHKMVIDCGCKGDSLGKIENGWISNLACVAIDAAGFYTEYYL